MARWIITIGFFLMLTGIILHFAPWLIHWFGRLPGDIHFEAGRSKIFIPVTSMLLISIIITVILNLFKH
ncbi:MAG: DUF2905 domain-containing protein [Candidatus Aureabacteria bacterium]|nr:DUF2905 domain-containing protein [Candidatus Auribacterota bacterium]